MQRIRALAWLLAAGLGALAVTLLLGRDDALPPLASPTAPQSVDPPPARAEPLVSNAPQLGSAAKAREALRTLQRELRTARQAPRLTVSHLARAPGWIRFVRTWLRLPAAEDDAERLVRIQAALGKATGPVVRQNLIFLAALALPLEVAAPWLESLAAGSDAADAEDALVALAFTGEHAARAAFARLARDPAPAPVRRIVDWYRAHDAMSQRNDDETRGILRSYRAIEAYLREPYFKMVAYDAAVGEQENRDWRRWVGWTEGVRLARHEDKALLEAWLARYPGHPGSDDMARRIAWSHVRAGELLDAARWYSRAAVLPDQDVAYSAVAGLAGLCEIDLAPEDVLRLSEDEGISTPNRRYFQYVWLRRLAAERGFAEALRALADFARREPDSEVAVAFAGRYTVPAPKGLTSGVTPLAPDDPLRRAPTGSIRWPARRHPRAPREGGGGIWTAGSGSDALRLHPWPDPVVLDRERLVGQLRVWETLAELERRTAHARGDARADLLYKQAAVFYHQRDALYPVYGGHTYDFSGKLRSVATGEGVATRRRAQFEAKSLAYVRSMALFERIEREHPHWRGLDKVIFSEGLLWRRLIDYRPSSHNVYWWRWSEPGELHAVRRTAETFERLVARFPDSPLADDAQAAAAWWRRARPAAFAPR